MRKPRSGRRYSLQTASCAREGRTVGTTEVAAARHKKNPRGNSALPPLTHSAARIGVFILTVHLKDSHQFIPVSAAPAGAVDEPAVRSDSIALPRGSFSYCSRGSRPF